MPREDGVGVVRRPLFTVTKTQHFATPRRSVIVMVDAKGPRGGIYHFTVVVDRKGAAQSCVRTQPDPKFLQREQAPHCVLNAAELAAREYYR